MDLLFKRYASPFSLLDNYISIGELSNFISDLYEIINEEKLWDIFLHKVYDQSWGEFLESAKPTKTESIDIGQTLMNSKNILDNFTPQEG